MLSFPFFKLGYFTDNVPAKASLATGAVFIERLCAYSPDACAFLGGIHQSVKALLLLMALDLLTGVMAARAEGQRIQSRRFGLGAQRKFGMLLVIYAAHLLDGVFGTGSAIFVGATWWYIATETISFYENADRMGVPMPPGLKRLMETVLQKANDTLGALTPTSAKPASEVVRPAENAPDA